MKLSNLTQGRNNNFNIIRIIAALGVLITHSFALAIGTSDAEPFRQTLGITMGEIAVDIFFITSGFLVTGSLLTRQSVIEFIWARVLRIFPALLMMLVLTVFGLGVFFTSLSMPSYISDSKTYIYLLKCSTLITGVAFNLPGVFDNNPYNNMVNGSLWTMPYEIKMYIILLIIFVVSGVLNKYKLKLIRILIIANFVVAGIFVVYFHFFVNDECLFAIYARLFFMFFSGAAFYLLKEHLKLSRLTFWIFVIAQLSSAMISKQAFFICYILTIAYILFYAAYIPSGWIRKYNQIGDYSYGIYIYAFPVQQSVAALVPRVSVLSMVSISASASLLLAALSWHLLERRALNLKGLYVSHTRRILSYGLSGVTGGFSLIKDSLRASSMK